MALGAILAGIGVVSSIVGAIGGASAAKDEAKAQRRTARRMHQNVKDQNETYAKLAEEASKAAKIAAEIQTKSAEEQNALVTDITAQLNAKRHEIVGAQNQQSDASIAAENARFKQMTLESMRRRRDILRNTIYAQALAKSGAVASGAQFGSGLQGGLAQITAEGASQGLTEYQNFSIGTSIFQANLAYTNAGSLVNQFQSELDSLRSFGDAELFKIQQTEKGELAVANAAASDTQAKLQKELLAKQTKADQIQSQGNIQVGDARSRQATYTGISSVGSSLISAGNSLFS